MRYYPNADIETLDRVVHRMLVASNSIASALIGVVGPGEFQKWQSPLEAMNQCKKLLPDKDDWYTAYEMWIMWRAAMDTSLELGEQAHD